MAGPEGTDVDCELPDVLGDDPDDGFWVRASACAPGSPGSSAITNKSRASRSIASVLKKQVA
jgi:hypothetical protein